MKNYRFFLGAAGMANLADGIATIVWVWVATLITRDAGLIALVPVALRLPWALFAIPAGLVADRVDRRRLIVAMDVLRAAAFAAAALALWLATPLPSVPSGGVSSVPLFAALCLSALMVGVAEVFRDNAAQAMLPAIVPEAGLERANARLWAVETIGNALIGPALGAMLLGVALALPFAANALAYCMAGLLVAGIAGRFHPRSGGDAQRQLWWQEVTQGFAFLRGAPLLRLLALITGFWNMFDAMVMFALVLLVQEKLGLSAGDYGLLLAAAALGAIASGLFGDRIVRAMGAARMMRFALLSGAPFFAVMAFAQNGLVIGLALGMTWFWGTTWNIVSVSTRQRLIPDMLRGRVNSLYRLLSWGMIPVGSFLAGQMISLTAPALGRIAAMELVLWSAAAGTVLLGLLARGALGRLLPGAVQGRA
ncbi:MAG: MFS transporter [Rhodobacter sp.]|nr:MFS transporter [Rhodobacter sp.]